MQEVSQSIALPTVTDAFLVTPFSVWLFELTSKKSSRTCLFYAKYAPRIPVNGYQRVIQLLSIPFRQGQSSRSKCPTDDCFYFPSNFEYGIEIVGPFHP